MFMAVTTLHYLSFILCINLAAMFFMGVSLIVGSQLKS